MKILAGAVLLFSLAASAVLFGTLQRRGAVAYTYRADEFLWPDSGWPAKDIQVWRGDLPSDLVAILQPGDAVALDGVGCRLPLVSREVQQLFVYRIYEAKRGDIPLGRFTAGRARFLLILTAFPLLAIVSGTIALLGRSRRPTPEAM